MDIILMRGLLLTTIHAFTQKYWQDFMFIATAMSPTVSWNVLCRITSWCLIQESTLHYLLYAMYVCVCSHMCICKFMDSDVSCFLCVGFSRSACVYLRLQSLPPPHCMSLSQCKNVHVNANVALPCHSLCLFDHPLFKLCSKEPQRNPQ